jgi:hypothetical protein
MIATLHLRLPELDAAGAARVAAVDAVLAKYSPDQPRDWHGRWTSEGDTGGPIEAGSVRRPTIRQAVPRADRDRTQPTSGTGRQGKPNAGGNGRPSPAGATQQTEPSSGDHQRSRPTGGRLIEADWQAEGDEGDSPGYGDNSGARPSPEGARGQEPDPDPALPSSKVPPGWDQPYRVINGVVRPAGRYPKLSDGRPWPPAQADEVYRILDPRRGAMPFVKLYVPLDGKGPVLMGSTDKEEFNQPPGYAAVYLRGVPQRTKSGGVDTAHALESVAAALRFAETNEYSDIFFNRSFSTISNGRYQAPYRADVVGLRRPTLDPTGEYDVYEVLSPRQSGPAREQLLRPAVPGGIRSFDGQAYKLLLKFLRALGLS